MVILLTFLTCEEYLQYMYVVERIDQFVHKCNSCADPAGEGDRDRTPSDKS